MKGSNLSTGKSLDGIEHLRQSIADILSTPLGSLVQRRDYGSRLPDLVDYPLNDTTIVLFYAATIEALEKWEPRIRITRVSAELQQPHQLTISLVGFYRHNGKEIVLQGIEI